MPNVEKHEVKVGEESRRTDLIKTMFEQRDKLEVKVSAEDKQELVAHMEAVNNILAKYPYFKDLKAHFVTTMSRAKNAARECGNLVGYLHVEKAESEGAV
jgi:hypothetical protein